MVRLSKTASFSYSSLMLAEMAFDLYLEAHLRLKVFAVDAV